MKIYLGADHGGYELKEAVKTWLIDQSYVVEDLGAAKFDENDDFPDYAFAVARKVKVAEKKGQAALGILFCSSGTGMTIAANKVENIRAVAIYDAKTARHAKAHNNANVVSFGGAWVSQQEATELISIFLNTKYEGSARHQRRNEKIDNFS